MLVLAEQNAEGESPDGCSAREPDPAGPAPCRVVLLSLAADQAGEEQDCGHSTCEQEEIRAALQRKLSRAGRQGKPGGEEVADGQYAKCQPGMQVDRAAQLSEAQ